MLFRSSETESQLLAALFKKMRLKTLVVPNGAGAVVKPAKKKPVETPAEFIPQNQAEQNMLEAVLELREVLAGRKEGMSFETMMRELDEELQHHGH